MRIRALSVPIMIFFVATRDAFLSNDACRPYFARTSCLLADFEEMMWRKEGNGSNDFRRLWQ